MRKKTAGITRLISYMQDTAGIDIRLEKLNGVKNIPLGIHAGYQFHRLIMLDKEFILAWPKHPSDLTPAVYKKHAEVIRKNTGSLPVLLLPACPAFARKRYIHHKLPFIVPGKQMYLPDLLIDLREHFTNIRQKQEQLGPAAQVCILYHLHNHLPQPFFPGALADMLPYTPMTMTRAIGELESHGLCRTDKQGKHKAVWFNYKARRLWDQALPLLQTPVKKHLFLENKLNQNDITLYTAGTAALGQKSMIAPDTVPEYAISQGTLKYLNENNGFTTTQLPENAGLRLEVWTYDPACLAKGKCVDDLSLYLALRSSTDERIQQALDKVIKEFPWQ